WPPAGRDEHGVGIDRAPTLQRQRDRAVGIVAAVLDAAAEMERDLLFLHFALERGGNLLVLAHHHSGQHLDHCRLGADRGEEARELAADDAAAEDRDPARLAREIQRLLAADHALAVER